MNKKFITILIALIFMFSALSVSAVPISFEDNSNYWPTWTNIEDDLIDCIGVPEFTGGIVDMDPNVLNYIEIAYNNYTNKFIFPGDLFLDIDNNGSWDYVVNTYGASTAGDYALLQLNTSTLNYIFSNNIFSGMLPSSYRQNHPVGLDLNDTTNYTNIGNVSFSGWMQPPYPTSTFDFGSSGLALNGVGLTFGFTVSCANDVIYEQVEPVPEPSTWLMLIFGMLFLGITIKSRERFCKQTTK